MYHKKKIINKKNKEKMFLSDLKKTLLTFVTLVTLLFVCNMTSHGTLKSVRRGV